MQNSQDAAASYEAGNVQVLYGTGQQISMFDQITENEGEADDGQGAIAVPHGIFHQ